VTVETALNAETGTHCCASWLSHLSKTPASCACAPTPVNNNATDQAAPPNHAALMTPSFQAAPVADVTPPTLERVQMRHGASDSDRERQPLRHDNARAFPVVTGAQVFGRRTNRHPGLLFRPGKTALITRMRAAMAWARGASAFELAAALLRADPERDRQRANAAPMGRRCHRRGQASSRTAKRRATAIEVLIPLAGRRGCGVAGPNRRKGLRRVPPPITEPARHGPTGMSLPTNAGGPEGLPFGEPPGGSTVTAKVAFSTMARS